jgi:hypothetical protein
VLALEAQGSAVPVWVAPELVARELAAQALAELELVVPALGEPV